MYSIYVKNSSGIPVENVLVSAMSNGVSVRTSAGPIASVTNQSGLAMIDDNTDVITDFTATAEGYAPTSCPAIPDGDCIIFIVPKESKVNTAITPAVTTPAETPVSMSGTHQAFALLILIIIIVAIYKAFN